MREKTALYLRLSKEDGDKEESNSIDSQRRLLLDYLDRKPELEFYDEYVDDGYSGTNYDRPAFQRMLADAEAKKITCILVKDLSRLGRNYLDTGNYIQRIFLEMGIRFIAVNDQVDTSDERQQGFDMMLPIRNIFNESYSQDISRKVQSSFKVMQKAGAFCGAHTSYGYRKNPADRHKLVIDPYAASVVRDIYDWYLSGVGQRTIAARLNEMGISCPSVYKRENGENYRNSKRLESTSYWTYATIHRILQNEMYKGCMVQNKSVRRMRGKAKKRPREEWIIVPGTHEAIIDPETWDRVQDILRLRTRTIDFEQNVSIFAGFLKCADCGRAMVKRQYTDRTGNKRWFYTCGAYSRSGTEVCSNHYIRHEILEQIILDDLNTVINSVNDIKSLIENQWSERPDYGKRQEKEAESVKKRIQKLERLKKESYLDYKENLLSREEYLDLREDYLRQEQSLKIKLEKLLCTESEEPEKMLNSPWVQSLLIHQKIDRLDRDMMVEFVEKIEIGEKNEDNQQEITIHYRFFDELENLFQMVYTGSE